MLWSSILMLFIQIMWWHMTMLFLLWEKFANFIGTVLILPRSLIVLAVYNLLLVPDYVYHYYNQFWAWLSFFVELIIYNFANFVLCLQVVPAWLNCLPIKGDLIEAKVVHDQLCLMAERLGPNSSFQLSDLLCIFFWCSNCPVYLQVG